MNLEEHIEALKTKHEALETAIDKESNRPHPDDITIANLKKRKLRIKDELAEMRH